jgi:histidinol dehydrogenase
MTVKMKRWQPSLREQFLRDLRERQGETDRQVEDVVRDIIDAVRSRGDEALLEFTERFDGAVLTPEAMRVPAAELEEAWQLMDEPYRQALDKAAGLIRAFHEKQRQESWFDHPGDGIWLGQKITPIDTAGVYVPGGTAAYPSSVLMNVLPAQVAGVRRIVMVTPPDAFGKINPVILAAARLAGVTEIYRAGGAQAVAALAYGTETIPRVDKITGPGNQYVAMAKRLVFGQVDIDMIAGPSEILVLADDTANPAFVAADMLSQAEHDQMASAICITTSKMLAESVCLELEAQLPKLEREKIARESLDRYGAVWITESMQEAVDLANDLAPEHLELCVADPFELLPKIRHAGAIFLGNYAPEPLGDYLAGPNHVLPTGGTARFASALSVDDFIKKSSLIYYSRDALEAVSDELMLLAEREGLQAHQHAIRIRR